MLKKSYTFGLLAVAAMMIAPSAAFAGTAVNTQDQSQSAVVRGENNTVVQQGSQTNRQTQSTRNSRGRYNRYGRNNNCRPGSQVAVSQQSQRQRADVSGYDNTVVQEGAQRNSQRQSNSCR